MSRNRENRIRDLFEQADRAAPSPPPMPELETPPFPWKRAVVAPAAAVLIVFVGVVVGLRVAGFDLLLGDAADVGDSVDSEDQHSLVSTLADLNVACSDFGDALDDGDLEMSDDASALRALEDMAVGLGPLMSTIHEVATQAPGSLEFSRADMSFDRFSDDMAAALALGSVGAADRYRQLRARLGDLLEDLNQIGAMDCANVL